jgi:glycosyltransferase involved in cell wall biosynthesis
MRIAIVYDCLFPHTVGGAERWYRSLSERLDEGHEVSYLTRRQWEGSDPGTPFRTVAVGGGGPLYTESGRRRIGPPLRFGLGVFWHLLRHGGDYDAVHTASFPYFSVLGAGLALRLGRRRARLVVDWHEFWSDAYWRSYLGPVGGRVGAAVQGLCLRFPDHSFTFSRLVAERLRERGVSGLTRLTGEYAGPERESPVSAASPPVAVAAARHIPEKHIDAVPAAIASARERIPELRGVILGDGPEAGAVRERVHELGLGEVVELRGRVAADEVDAALAEASCLVHPSEREGYGLVVVEAAASGTPAVVVAGPENAAVELIEAGVNGEVAASRGPAELGAAIAAVVEGGDARRAATHGWYRAHRDELSLESSLAAVEAAYSADSP